MRLDTVIFDMDGVLIDSEPLWEEAGAELLARYGCVLTHEQYVRSTGLRTREWLEHWFRHFDLEMTTLDRAEQRILDSVLEKIKQRGQAMLGVDHVFDYFRKKGFKIGVATSSPALLAEHVLRQIGVAAQVSAMASAEHLPYGKPHPQVYLNCAAMLQAEPYECLCFEDSINGLIAAKAARMKCVIVPGKHQQTIPQWGIADMKISSLQNFNDLLLNQL
jgi:mannitol-1-/sugar-/sorbitol-6-/2-deoxyglucose-6-phosphatase